MASSRDEMNGTCLGSHSVAEFVAYSHCAGVYAANYGTKPDNYWIGL